MLLPTSSSVTTPALLTNFSKNQAIQATGNLALANAQLAKTPLNPNAPQVQAALQRLVSINSARSEGASQNLAKFDSISEALGLVNGKLDELKELADLAAAAPVGARAGFQSAASTLILEIQAALIQPGLEAPGAGASTAITPNAAFSPNGVKSLTIDTLSDEHIANGSVQIFVISATAFLPATGNGDVAGLANAVSTGAGTIGGQVDFTIGGKFGSETFSFAAGTSINTIADAINIKKVDTGVEAIINGNDIDLQATQFGVDAFIDLTETTDVAANINPGNDVGVNASVIVTAPVFDFTQVFEGGQDGLGGRQIKFDVDGISGVVNLSQSTTDLAPLAGGFLVTLVTAYADGNVTISTPSNADLLNNLNLPGLNFGELAGNEGGLGSVDLVNDPGQAKLVFQAAQDSVQTSLDITDAVRENLLGPIVSNAQNLSSTVSSALFDIYSAQSSLLSFQSALTQSDKAIAEGVLGQLSGLFPSALGKYL